MAKDKDKDDEVREMRSAGPIHTREDKKEEEDKKRGIVEERKDDGTRESKVESQSGLNVKDDKPLSKEEAVRIPSATREVEGLSSDDREEQKKQLLGEATKILEQYNMQESTIPLDSTYWTLMNKYRGLR